MKTFLKIMVFLVSFGAFAQGDKSYQYWIDKGTASEITALPAGSVFPVDIAGLKPGGHVIKYRLKGSDNNWGVPLNSYFYIPLPKVSVSTSNKKYEYWLDNDISNRVTKDFGTGSEIFEIDFSNVPEGGHMLNYRIMGDNDKWGTVMRKPLYFPITPKKSSRKAVAYREFINNEIINEGTIDEGTETLNLSQNAPTNNILGGVKTRSFSFLNDEVTMKVDGYYSYAVQLKSDLGEWGAPVYIEEDISATDKVTPKYESTAMIHTISKVDNNHFQAFKFNNHQHSIYIESDQDCYLSLYYVSGTDYMRAITTDVRLSKGVVVPFDQSQFLREDDVVAVFYNTPTNSQNPADKINVNIMYGNHKVPDPVITYDEESWDISIECYDERAKIFYTKKDPSDAGSQYEPYVGPFHITEPTTVWAKATLENFDDSEVVKANAAKFTVPAPMIEYVGGNLFKLTSKLDGVTIHYTLDDTDPSVSSTSKIFDGEPFPIESWRYVWAYAVKEGINEPSQSFYQCVYLSSYRTEAPSRYSWDDSSISFYVPEGQAYYRTFVGKDESAAGEWKKYESSYTNIEIAPNTSIQIYAESENKSDSEIVTHYTDEWMRAPEPNISYLDGYVTASGVDDGVLVKFFNQDGKECELDPENPLRAKFVYNDIITAYAYKPGFLDSSYVTIEPCDQPEIYLDKFTVSIVAPYNATVKYTIDGSDPTSESESYSTPFKVTSTCDIKAVAFPRFKSELPSMAVEHVDYVKAKAPTLTSYDGRYVTLSAENEDSKIMYVIGESGNAANGDEALDKIELGGINVIRAIAQNDDEDDSDEFTFTPQYYADETDVYTSAPGVINEAFGWCEDLSSIEKIAVHGSLLDSSNKDSGDYEYLRSLPGLRHLDLTNVTDTIVPDTALVSNKLLAVTMPKTIKKVGKTIFGESNTTLCAIELPGNEYAPADLLNGVKNPNLLLYTKDKANVADLRTDDGAEVKNVVLIASGSGVSRADEVTLVNTYAFHAPKEFTAKKISFTRPFTKETQLEGNGAGWETMVVPFEVQSVKASDDRNLKPFGEANLNAGDCPFWLFKAYDGEWVKDSYIEANSPYLIAFPNNPMYADEYSINGNVTFSSANVSVPETPADDGESMSANFSTNRYVNGNYNFIAKAEDIFALNDEDYTDGTHTYKPGGIFVANKRDVAPFECYVTAASEMKAVPLFDSSDVEGILGEYGTRIWSEGHNIYISSGIGMKIHIFDTVGQLIRIVNVKAGETACAENLTPGIYIVGNTKIYVK